jgi:hypothetical protein
MSYTPDDQLLESPLIKAADSLMELQNPIKERLRHPDEWRKDHMEELQQLLRDVSDMEFRLRMLAMEVR